MKLQGPRTSITPAFDSLTSFSQQASGAVSQTLTKDVLKILQIFPAEKTRYAGYFTVRRKRYISSYGSALKKFLAEVDQSILFTTRSIRCPSIAVYNWLASGNTERRMQALRAYPVMIPMEIIITTGLAGPETLAELTSLIDQGETFFPLLARLHGTTPATIKKLGRLSPYIVGSALSWLKYDFSRDYVRRLIECFALGTKRPITQKGWKNCLMTTGGTNIQITESNLSGMPAWESNEWIDLYPQIRSLQDLGRCRNILGARSLRKTLSFSREWHEKRAQVQSDLLSTGAYRASSWPGMLKDNVQHPATGLVFTEILNDLALAHEGESMGHCVGGYSRPCFDADSRIISIRDGNTSVATLQFRLEVLKSGRKTYRCVQAQGPGNTPLKKKPAAALEWFTKNLRQFVGTYDLPVVPRSQRPEGKSSLSKMVQEHMDKWVAAKMEKLGHGEEFKALNQHYEYYAN
jgi:hypothetical protein